MLKTYTMPVSSISNYKRLNDVYNSKNKTYHKKDECSQYQVRVNYDSNLYKLNVLAVHFKKGGKKADWS